MGNPCWTALLVYTTQSGESPCIFLDQSLELGTTEVVWTGPARAELREIRNYIAADNPAAAKRVIQEIEAGVDQLETMPFGFPAYKPSRDENTRHMVVGNYRIFYRCPVSAGTGIRGWLG